MACERLGRTAGTLGLSVIFTLAPACTTLEKPSSTLSFEEQAYRDIEARCKVKDEGDDQQAKLVCIDRKTGEKRDLTSEETKAHMGYGALSRFEIERVIRSNLPKIKTCYNDDALKQDEKGLGSGRIVSNFTIAPTGKVSKAEVQADQKSPLVGTEPSLSNFMACVRDVVLSMNFPQPRRGGIVQVKYPFIFSRD